MNNKETLTGMALKVAQFVWWAHESGALVTTTVRFGDSHKFEVTVASDGIIVEIKHGFDSPSGWQVITNVMTFAAGTSDRLIFQAIRRRLDHIRNLTPAKV